MCDISVVIPLYNKENYVKRAVESVLSQTNQRFEIVIVDDGSTDQSYQKAAEIKDSRIRIIQQQNAGASAARNKGITEAKADYIAFLDADDTWNPTFLETIFRLIEKYPEAGAYATSYQIILKNQRKLVPSFDYIPPSPWEGFITHYSKSVLRDLPIISSAVVIPKKTFAHVGLFAIGHPHGEDQDMWFRISMYRHIAYSHTNQATYYRGLPNSMCTVLHTYQPYPIIDTIKKAIDHKKVRETSDLKEYLVKLELDYAERLINTNRLKEAYELLEGIATTRYQLKKGKVFFLYWKERFSGHVMNRIRRARKYDRRF
ncbi:glycosyltransferase family 2 protein [Bacillus weihaiensis]|uniref:Glycosyltransferase 2-like domain-containing protein n=1 Tax=Bacillus weihaiensis TaxID=1547283 RepID=A0A1L3MUN9_9BACI|nr:glycosyltransferase family 2 protein [Bacillus weihaiensis]APH06057.1 hypothetical protein A9C19_15640 [Bacillus weihaiensis]